MAQIYEISAFDSHMPLRCTIQKIGVVAAHKHDYFEIDLLLAGVCSVIIDDKLYTLSTDDVFSVNPHTNHELHGKDCVLVTIQFEQSFFEQNLPRPLHPEFNCNSKVQGDTEAIKSLRFLIARIIKNNADQQTGYELRNLSLIYELMDLFYNNFRVRRSEAQDIKNHRYSVRISEITKIIRENYAENLSLSDLAQMVHLSPPYLSKFFDRHFGTTFLSYLTQFRLSRAVHELTETTKNIEEISADNGFANSHAFVQAFKKEYNMLPSVYRRRQKEADVSENVLPVVVHHDYMSGLKKYLKHGETPQNIVQALSCNIHLEAGKENGTLRHTWRNVMNVASAFDLLISDIQEMIKRMQREVGFRYIHFTGVFSDDLRVCNRLPNGKLVFNFAYLDKIFDFVLSVGLKPFVQLTYMPNALARDSSRRLFNSIVSAPSDNREWCQLVREFLHHLIAHYSLEEVSGWYFCIWNQPDTPEKLYGFGDDNRFFDFYLQTYQAVKQCNPALQIAMTPTFYILSEGYTNWYLGFVEKCRRYGCLPDALTFTYYDTTMFTEHNRSRQNFGFVYTMSLSTDENSFTNFITQVLSERDSLKLNDIPVYLTEWNSTPSQQDLLNDTCFKSCYLVKNILQNYDRIYGFGYWSLTDLMGEAPLPEHEFFGGLGLFSKDGIPKPAYYALTLLKQLGSTFIDRDKGWFATKEKNVYKILVYNYRHYSRLYAMAEKFDMTFTDRYTVFEPHQSLDVHLKIDGIENGDYLVRETTLNRSHGSAFDLWVEMGALEPDAEEDFATLRGKSVPMCSKYIQPVENGCFEADAILDVLEVRLITIRKLEKE